MLLDLLSQIESDDSWRGSYPDWFPRLSARAPYPTGAASVVVTTSTVTAAPASGSGVITNKQLQYQQIASPLPTRNLEATAPTAGIALAQQFVQYQAQAFPFSAAFVTTPAQPYLQSEMPIRQRLLPTAALPTGSFGSEPTVNPFWASVYPDRLFRSPSVAMVPTLAFTPTHNPSEGNALDWWPRYPDRLWQPWLLTAAQQTFAYTPDLTTTSPLTWTGSYPDRFPAPWRPATFGVWVPQHTPAEGQFPDWHPQAPDWTARPSPWQDRAQMAAFYPFPFAPFNPAVARFDAVYPDWISRVTLRTATIPFFVPGPFEPIPNPPVTNLPKDLHLGTIESLGMTPDPTIGGWQSW